MECYSPSFALSFYFCVSLFPFSLSLMTYSSVICSGLSLDWILDGCAKFLFNTQIHFDGKCVALSRGASTFGQLSFIDFLFH